MSEDTYTLRKEVADELDRVRKQLTRESGAVWSREQTLAFAIHLAGALGKCVAFPKAVTT